MSKHAEQSKRKRNKGGSKPKEVVQVATETQTKVEEVPAPVEVIPSAQSNTTDATVPPVKSREEILAEREAKKLAKLARKTKGEQSSVDEVDKATITTRPADVKPVETKAKIDRPLVEATNNITNAETQEKSKSELKAERRAKQEAQRAAKEAAKLTVETKENKKPAPTKSDGITKTVTPVEIKKQGTPEKKTKQTQNQHKVKLFHHLYNERERPAIPLNSKEIHPAIVRLGVQYASHVIIGSNARCIALLNALKEVVRDYSLPPNVEFSRGFEAHLAPCLKFLNTCRPPAVSMNNALKHIKWQLTQLLNVTVESEGKFKLYDAIDVYIKDQIEVAGNAISMAVKNKIAQDDVILTYGCSSLIEQILVDASLEKKFRVIVVEAHPWNEGKEMLRRLTARGINCSLVMISALSFVMREINKVMLGAGALLANGYVMARSGTAQVAMVAHAFNVPVLVCCETHKFSERVQTDSFVYNELGDPDALIDSNSMNVTNPLSNWRNYSTFSPLNIFYDVTPPDLVTAVVTELAILPCTSVPVILRMKPSEFM